MAHEYRSRSGNIVDAVRQTVSRGLVFVINAPLFAEPVAVDLVAEAKNYDGDDQEDKTVHVGKFFLSLKNRKIIYVKLILPRLMILTPFYNTAQQSDRSPLPLIIHAAVPCSDFVCLLVNHQALAFITVSLQTIMPEP